MKAATIESAMSVIWERWHTDYPKTENDRRINATIESLLEERMPIAGIEKFATLLEQIETRTLECCE